MRRIGSRIATTPNTATLPSTSDHEQAHEEVDPVDARGLGVGLTLALLGGGDQSRGRIPDQRVHRIAELAGARNLGHGVAIVPGGGRELFDDAGIVRQQLRQLFEALLVRGVVGELERGLDPPRRFLRVGPQPLERVIDFAGRDGEANFARLDLHALELDRGAQRLVGHALLAAGGGALPRCPMIAELLFRQHGGHEQHADAGPDRELGADG